MANARFASKKYALGVCDMCGRADLKLRQLRKEIYNQRTTGFLVCDECWDEDNPQLQLGRYPIDDPQALDNPRPDAGVDISRILWGFNPVGNASTQILGFSGQATINPDPDVYVASGVRFDGTSYLTNSALVASDSTSVSMSYWINIPVGHTIQQPFFGSSGTVAVESYQQLAAPGAVGVEVDIFAPGPDAVAVSTTSSQTPATWFNVLCSIEATGSSRAKLYVNGVDLTNLFLDSPLTMLFSGQPFSFGASPGDFGGPPPAMTADVADVWIAPGVSLLDATGDIPLSTRRLFLDASLRPTNPTGFPASAILFSGDAASFATNQGSGGAFTTTGTLTDAPTSP